MFAEPQTDSKRLLMLRLDDPEDAARRTGNVLVSTAGVVARQLLWRCPSLHEWGCVGRAVSSPDSPVLHYPVYGACDHLQVYGKVPVQRLIGSEHNLPLHRTASGTATHRSICQGLSRPRYALLRKAERSTRSVGEGMCGGFTSCEHKVLFPSHAEGTAECLLGLIGPWWVWQRGAGRGEYSEMGGGQASHLMSSNCLRNQQRSAPERSPTRPPESIYIRRPHCLHHYCRLSSSPCLQTPT